MEDPLRDFLIAFLALQIGLLLYIMRRVKDARKFVDSMMILMLIVSPLGLTIPLLIQYQGYFYYFIPIFLLAVNGWLLHSKNSVFGTTYWEQEKNKERDGVLAVWYILMAGFFLITIYLVWQIPQNPKLALP